MGAEESKVHLGEVRASKVRCDSGYSHLIDQAAGDSAATSLRSIEQTGSMSPRLTLYGLSPFFHTPGHGKLAVERLDVKGERYDINLASASRSRGASTLTLRRSALH